MTVVRTITDAAATAAGREQRDDPVLPRTGGPAGNAQLTAWLGLVLLLVLLAELVTLLDLTRLASWHVIIGVLLVPPALAKTATTGWRMLRYYAGARPYRRAGPPPLLLRLLGPLVVIGTLALLGTGLGLVAIGPDASFAPLVSVAGQRISPLTLHQASFVGWGVVTGLHLLASLVPAAWLAMGRRPDGGWLPGTAGRLLLLGGAVAAGAVAAALVLGPAGGWTGGYWR
ncbi:MAG: hypothetical protein ACJ74O_13090 [Frankiaceae bacterium]